MTPPSTAQSFHIRKLHADLDTPVTTYLKLRGLAPWSFLLESVEGPAHWASFSILGFGARRTFIAHGGHLTITHRDGRQHQIHAADPLAALQQALREEPLARQEGLPHFVGGVFGYLAYDAVRSFEPLPAIDSPAEVPDASFVEPEVLAVFDHRQHELTLFARNTDDLDRAVQALRGPLPAPIPSKPWQQPTASMSREAYQAAVECTKEHIRAGDIIQLVLSRRFELPRVADPFDVYRGLRKINPSPYLFFVSTPNLELAGASPEVMVRVRDNKVIVRPIAGTRPRGHTAAEDKALEQELLADPKERAEHIMLVDLGRNDVGRISAPGTVHVTDLMVVERYSHVMHMVSEVQGELAPQYTMFDALRAAFPAGTLSGAPKVRAMQLIDGLEPQRRGVYGGAVGYFGPWGDADFGIAIRTLVAHPDRFIIQAGAGIVADSDPAREADETEHKARGVLRAAEWATQQHDGARAESKVRS